MITQLSARSRITSNSNSFHPAIDCSMRISEIGLADRLGAASDDSHRARGVGQGVIHDAIPGFSCRPGVASLQSVGPRKG
jgi:hypothetical protein